MTEINIQIFKFLNKLLRSFEIKYTNSNICYFTIDFRKSPANLEIPKSIQSISNTGYKIEIPLTIA